MLNNTRKMRMMIGAANTSTTTAKRSAYELLSKSNAHALEQHYCSSEVEIMEPETYGGLLNSLPSPPSLNAAPPSIASSTTANYEIYPSSRRQSLKKRYDHVVTAPVATADNQDERIEVKILPQDDNWGEPANTSCRLGNEDTLTNNNDTSVQLNDHLHPSGSHQHLADQISRRPLSIKLCHFALYLLCFIAFISPVLFLTLPYALISSDSIVINDYTPLLTIIFKLILLFSGTVLLLYRRRNIAYLPRVHLAKMSLIILLIVILLTYWFYYVFKLLLPAADKYERILAMSSDYEDLLLLLLLLSVLIFEIRSLHSKWIVKVVRSPDGQTRHYNIGSMSIQEASVFLLEQYYKDFPVFNPWLENAHQSQAKRPGTFSIKSLGSQSNSSTIAGMRDGNKHILTGDLGRSMRPYSDRFYDELEYERRVRKRRTKLLSSCEDAFTNVRKCLSDKHGSNVPMDAREAAQAVFSSMSRSLQKYLRITRQQPYFTRQSIISHLTSCLSHDLSPKAFLERYIQIDAQPLATLLFPALESSSERLEQSWTITCDEQSAVHETEERKIRSINRNISSNLLVVLKQQHAEHIVLICTFHAMPKVHLLERVFNFKQNKFLLKLNSETSV